MSESLVQLPTGLQLEAEEAAALADLIAWCVRNGPEISARLARQAGQTVPKAQPLRVPVIEE